VLGVLGWADRHGLPSKLVLQHLYPRKSGLTIARAGRGMSPTQDLEPAETLFRLGSIPTFFRLGKPRFNHPGKRRIRMKTKFPYLIIAFACFALRPHIHAQCPQTCNTILFNTALGTFALDSITFGNHDTAVGMRSLNLNTTGSFNTSIGADALKNNVSGRGNTAGGSSALFSNTTGDNNTAIGLAALSSNTTGTVNTASGGDALTSNTTGSFNTATGYGALSGNTTGASNTATGANAIQVNTTGSANTATGLAALAS
jgi:hypothetical protein